MDRIADRLCIDVLESLINTGTDELRVGEFSIAIPKTSRHIWSRPAVKEWILEVLSALIIS